jgi:hypothetical protein
MVGATPMFLGTRRSRSSKKRTGASAKVESYGSIATTSQTCFVGRQSGRVYLLRLSGADSWLQIRPGCEPTILIRDHHTRHDDRFDLSRSNVENRHRDSNPDSNIVFP